MDPVAGVPNFFEKEKLFTYRRFPIFDNQAEDISAVLEGCIAFIDQAKYYGSDSTFEAYRAWILFVCTHNVQVRITLCIPGICQ